MDNNCARLGHASNPDGGPLCLYCGVHIGGGLPTREEARAAFAQEEVGSLAYFRAAVRCGVDSPEYRLAEVEARKIGRQLAR
jgi:hypothetical protein